MIILGATIDGFGKWTDTNFDFTDSKVNCFYGNNESGKSTLQQFLLYMLFSLPPKKRREFIPKNRSEIGGSLTIQDTETGIITIQRKEDICKCMLADGSIKDESWWGTYLKGLTRDVYTSVYAFSATELSAIQTMDKAAVSNVLFSVALSGSTAIYDAERQLLKQLDELYKRRGQKPVLNQQLTKVSKYNNALIEAEKAVQTYRPLHEEISRIKKLLCETKDTVQAKQERILLIENIIQLLPQIQMHHHHQEKLSAFSSDIRFPADGVSRHQQIKEYMLPEKSELNILQKKYEQVSEKKKEFEDNLSSVKDIQQAKKLVNETSTYAYQCKQLEHFERQLLVLHDTYQSLLYELQWEKDEAEGIILPFHLESAWEDVSAAQNRLHKDQEALEQKIFVYENKQAKLSDEAEELSQQLLPEAMVSDMEQKLNKHNVKIDHEQQKSNYQTWKTNQKKKTKGLLFTCAGLAGLFFLIAMYMEQPIIYSLPVIFILTGGMHYFYAGNHIKVMENLLSNESEDVGLSDAERANYKEQLKEEKDLQFRLATITNELRQLEFLLLQEEDHKQVLEEREAQLYERVDGERFVYPFLRNVNVSNWLSLLKRLRKLKEVTNEKTVIKKEMTEIQNMINAIDEALAAFPYGSDFPEIELFIQDQSRIQSSVEQYKQELLEYEAKIEEIEEKLHIYEVEIKELFDAANVTNEDDFYKVSEEVNEKNKLTAESDEIRQRLEQFFSSDQVDDLLNQTLTNAELTSEKIRLQEDMKELKNAESDNNHRLAELEVRVEQLEFSDDTSTLHLQVQTEKELLNQLAEKWAVLRLAYAAIRQAKQTYHEKYFNDVIDLMSKFFKQLTNGKYDTVYGPTDTTLFQVEGNQDIRYTVDELSKGTIDQLYVALRFAIARVMSGAFKIPIFVDDAFIHFDGVRTEQAIKLLKEIGMEQQIIFFTCKQDVSTLFDSVYSMEYGIEC